MILRGIVTALLAFGDDVVLERDAVFVALHDHEFPPPPRQMHPQRELVAPGADAVDDLVLGQRLDQRVDGGEDGLAEEVLVIAVVFLLALHRLPLSGELLRRDVLEHRDPRQPPFRERLVEHGRNDSGDPCRRRRNSTRVLTASGL